MQLCLLFALLVYATTSVRLTMQCGIVVYIELYLLLQYYHFCIGSRIGKDEYGIWKLDMRMDVDTV